MKRNYPLFIISLFLFFGIGMYLNKVLPYVAILGSRVASIDIFFSIVFLLLVTRHLMMKRKQ